MITNEEAALIVDMFEIRSILREEEEIGLLDPETILAYTGIVLMADKADADFDEKEHRNILHIRDRAVREIS